MLTSPGFFKSPGFFFKEANLYMIVLILSSANAFNLDQSKILSFGKELKKKEETPGLGELVGGC